MHGLADLQHHIVGDVHHIRDAAQTAQRQLPPHPPGRLARGDIAHIVPQIPGAKLRRLHPDAQAGIDIGALRIIRGGHVQGLIQRGSHLPGDAQNRLAVRPVGGDGDIKEIIVQPRDLADVRAGDGIPGQLQQAVDLRAGIQIIVEPQLLAGAEHAVGGLAPHGLCLDGDAAGQRGAVQSGGRMHTGIYIGCAGDDLDVPAVFAAIHLANEQMGALHGRAFLHLAHHHAPDAGGKVDELLHLKAAVKEPCLQLLGGNVDVHILLEPAERYFHGFPLLNP